MIYDGVVTRARISSVDGWVLPQDASPRPVRIACATGSCQLVFDLWDLVRFTRFTGSSVEVPMVITGELEGRGIFSATTGVRVTVELDER